MPELIAAAVVLTATLVVALIPMIRATSATDRMLATQLIGTSGVGLLLLLAPLRRNGNSPIRILPMRK